MSEQQPIKKRIRLEGQVSRLAQFSTKAAQVVSIFGVMDNPAQIAVRGYLAAKADCEKDKTLQPHFRDIQNVFANYVLKAIANCDVDIIQCIADELKERRITPHLMGEIWRRALIEKARIEKTGDGMTVNELKDVLKCSYEHAKYLCRKLKIPTVRDKVGRKKLGKLSPQKRLNVLS